MPYVSVCTHVCRFMCKYMYMCRRAYGSRDVRVCMIVCVMCVCVHVCMIVCVFKTL